MKVRLLLCAAALALLADAGAAAAQSTVTTRKTVTTKETVRLSPSHRTTISRRVTQHPRSISLPGGGVVVQKQTENVATESRVPEAVDLYGLPGPAASEVPIVEPSVPLVEPAEIPIVEPAVVPAVKQYKYMVVNNQVLMVDPDTSQVVEIIRH